MKLSSLSDESTYLKTAETQQNNKTTSTIRNKDDPPKKNQEIVPIFAAR
ncbi:MAG: hypothetical protein ACK53Y_16050 [bacterium]